VHRGELWTVAGGVYATKPRPALVLQDDHFDATDSLTVLPLTTTDVNAPLLRIPVPPNDTSGLAQISFIMVDKATTVRRSNVRQLVGHLSSQQMTQVERALMVFLGLAD